MLWWVWLLLLGRFRLGLGQLAILSKIVHGRRAKKMVVFMRDVCILAGLRRKAALSNSLASLDRDVLGAHMRC